VSRAYANAAALRWADEWCPQVKGATRAVLRVLAQHANADGWAWPSFATIAYKAGVSERTVIRCIQRLIALGIIAQVIRYPKPGRSHVNKYRLALELGWNDEFSDPISLAGKGDTKGDRKADQKGGLVSKKGCHGVTRSTYVLQEGDDSVVASAGGSGAAVVGQRVGGVDDEDREKWVGIYWDKFGEVDDEFGEDVAERLNRQWRSSLQSNPRDAANGIAKELRRLRSAKPALPEGVVTVDEDGRRRFKGVGELAGVTVDSSGDVYFTTELMLTRTSDEQAALSASAKAAWLAGA
jgi:hypothetical protein